MSGAAADKSTRPNRQRGLWTSLLAAAAALALATVIRALLDPLLGQSYPFVTYLGAVALIAWFGRTAAALVTLVVGGVLSVHLFAPNDSGIWWGMGLYTIVAAVIVAMSHALRGVQRRCESLLDEAVNHADLLRQSVSAEAKQREKLSITLASIGDAVITADTSGRVSLFNPVAELLTGWTLADAVGQPLTQILRIVNEDTRLPVDNPALRALADGAVVGLEHHSVLISKDGTERPIEDSAAPIRGTDGQIVGCVLVFRDISARKALDAARQEAQEQMSNMLESVTDGFIRYDRDWRIVYMNAEAERINQIGREVAIGREVWQLFPAVVGTRLEFEFRRAVAQRVTVEFENFYEPWGRWFSLKGYPTQDGGLTTFVRDITEQKAQRDALVESEARFRELADAMPQIVYSSDAEGRVDFANHQWFDYTGQTDAQTADLSALVHPDDLAPMVQQWQRALASGTTLQAEFRLRRASDDEYRWFLTRSVPVRDKSGRIVKWFGTSTDIDDQKRTERQLAESEARYRAIGESIDFGVWMCDATGRNTYASESFLRMVGITQQECSDFGWGDVLHPDDAAATIAAWKECVRTNGTWDRVHRFRGADGSWYSVLARGVPVRNSAGDVLGWAGINLDITHLVQTEQELVKLAADSERQRRLYETVLSNTPDLAYVFDLNHRFTYANHALLAMWGRSWEDAIGKVFLDLGYEPWHAAMHDREIEQVVATKQPIRGEVAFDGTNGIRQYEYIFVPVLGADGEVEAVAGTTRDITDRLRTEQQLRANEERQSFLVTLADTIRPLADPLSVQIEVSRLLGEKLRAQRVAYFEVQDGDFVIERDYIDGVPSMAGVHPATAFGPQLTSTFQSGETATETDAEARGGEERLAFAAIQTRAFVAVPLIKNGEFVAGLGVACAHPRQWTSVEIAMIEETAERTWAAVERVRAEAALRISEDRFRTLFNTMEEGFCIIDVEFDAACRPIDYRIEEMNPAFAQHTGLRELAGRSIREAIPTLEEFWFATYGRVAATGEPVRFTHQAEPMDGRWFDVSAFRLGGDDSNKVAVLFNDITARKAAEAEGQRLLDQLREQDRRKDEFLATLAHELRNPLAPLSNGLELIRVTGADGVVAQARSMMERQLVQMTRLVDDLLDVSRVTTGRLALRLERLELRTVIETGLETSRPVIEQHGHELTVTLPEEPIFVHGDPIRLAQVVSNLLTNSAKYTDRGGQIRASVAREKDMVVVTVADNGIGIPSDMLERVFDKFTQVDRTLEKSTGGLGIGLSLVRGLVEMHGGTIEARSDGEGKGSEFEVRLPMAR